MKIVMLTSSGLFFFLKKQPTCFYYVTESQPMTMEEILNKYALPSLVEMEPQEKQVKVKVGNSIRNLGRFLLLSKYEENYLKQNCIDGDGEKC